MPYITVHYVYFDQLTPVVSPSYPRRDSANSAPYTVRIGASIKVTNSRGLPDIPQGQGRANSGSGDAPSRL